MKKFFNATKPFIQEILSDFMLVACLLAPIFMGFVFKFLLPLLESYLCSELSKSLVIEPYYLVFDLLLAIMTPIMFIFSGVMTTLSEIDNGTAKYLCVTPIGKQGYLISRIGFPSCIGFIYDIILLLIFTLTNLSLLKIIIISFLCVLLSLITAMLVISIAKNKLEGMALIKLSGFLILGIPAVYFIPSFVKYFFAILPSYWITEFARTDKAIFLLPSLFVSFVWIFFLSFKFKKKFL